MIDAECFFCHRQSCEGCIWRDSEQNPARATDKLRSLFTGLRPVLLRTDCYVGGTNDENDK